MKLYLTFKVMKKNVRILYSFCITKSIKIIIIIVMVDYYYDYILNE